MPTASTLVQAGTRSVLVSATPFVRRQLVPQRRAPTVLGRFPSALYLELHNGSVIAILTSDAVSLPIGLVLPTSSSQTPLDDDLPVEVSDGTVHLGGLAIVAARERSARADVVGIPVPERIAQALAELGPQFARTQLPADAAHAVTRARSADDARRAVRALLGRGPGLTPSGDDLIAGVLAGGVLFGREAAHVRRAVLGELTERPRATTSLSRQLLERACDDDVLPEVAAFGIALCRDDAPAVDRALARLLLIGHSSGVAIAYGVLAACELP